MNLSETQREAIKQARREYQREWRRKNPDKVKAAQERHWLRKAAQLAKEQEAENERAG